MLAAAPAVQRCYGAPGQPERQAALGSAMREVMQATSGAQSICTLVECSPTRKRTLVIFPFPGSVPRKCAGSHLDHRATCGAGAERDPGSAAASQASAAGKRGGGGAAKRAGAGAHSPHRLLAAVRKIAPQFKVLACA